MATKTLTGGIDFLANGNLTNPYANGRAASCGGGLSAILLGDSINANNQGFGPYTDASATYFDGYFTAFNIKAGMPFTSVWNAGKGGDTTAMIAARLATDVTPYRADWGFLMAGTNDFGLSAATLAQAKANYLLIVAALRARVDNLVIIPILPRGTLTTQARTDMIAFNAWLRTIAPAYNAIIADIGRSIVDPTSATLWDMQEQYNRDSVGVRLHPNDLGASVLGSALMRFLPNLKSVGRSSPMDGSNLLVNGELTGTTTPTSWNAFGTLSAHTRTNRPDGEPGIFYGATTTDFINLTQNVFSGFSIGERYVLEFEFIGAPSGLSAVYAQADLSGGASFVGNKVNATITGQIPASGVVRTPEFVIPAGTTSISCFCYFQGAGTYKVARPHLRKVS